MRILSMRRTSSFSYWVYAGLRLFHTEFAQEVVFFILSMRRMPSFSYWVCAGRHLIHTEYTQDVVFFILSMRRTSSYSYWVYAECRLNYTEHKLRENFAFGQTKSPITHLNWLFIGTSLREDASGPRWTFSKIFFSLILKFCSHPAYAEYTQDEPRSHPIGPIKKFLSHAGLLTKYIRPTAKYWKSMTSKISCQCTLNGGVLSAFIRKNSHVYNLMKTVFEEEYLKCY